MTHTPSFLFIMDPAETLNLETETSLLLMDELITRGMAVYWAEVDDLILRQNTLLVQARRVEAAMPLTLSAQAEKPAAAFSAIVPRTDPPVNEAFLHLTYLLDFAPGHVHQFNRVTALRDMNEKLLPLVWPDLVPPTLTTMNTAAIEAFVEEQGTVVLKPAAAFSAIVPRTDPPVNEAFLHLTYLLDFAPGHVHQFNRVTALRDMNEKLLPLVWPDLVPPTLTTMNTAAIEAFVEEQGTVVLKPLGDCSGRGIERVGTSGDGWRETVRAFVGHGAAARTIQAQAFLSDVAAGDKRVFLLNGEPIGAVNRVPREGAYLANIHQGARVEATELSAHEREAVARIAPLLRRRGLMLVGADFIGGYLTELNITSPSAVRQINAVMGARLECQIVDAMLAAVSDTDPQGVPDTCPVLCCA